MMEHEVEKDDEPPKVSFEANHVMHTTPTHVVFTDKLGRPWVIDIATSKARIVEVEVPAGAGEPPAVIHSVLPASQRCRAER